MTTIERTILENQLAIMKTLCDIRYGVSNNQRYFCDYVPIAEIRNTEGLLNKK